MPILIFFFRSTVARIQFRLPDGSSFTNQFPSDAPLEEARQFAAQVNLCLVLSCGEVDEQVIKMEENISRPDLQSVSHDLCPGGKHQSALGCYGASVMYQCHAAEAHMFVVNKNRDLLISYNRLWKLFSLLLQMILQRSNLRELSPIKGCSFFSSFFTFFAGHFGLAIFLPSARWPSLKISNLYLVTSIFFRNLLPECGLTQNLSWYEILYLRK